MNCKLAITTSIAGILIGASIVSSVYAKPKKTPSPPHALENTLAAFNDICLSTAPSFKKAENAAKKYGVTNYMDLGELRLGVTKDRDFSVQITPTKECAIGGRTGEGPEVLDAFVRLIASKAQKLPNPLPKTTPFPAVINGKTYIFHLDRHGGDTFVMAPHN